MHIMSLGLQKDYSENTLGMKGWAPSGGLESGSSDSDSGEEDKISLDDGSDTRAATAQIMKDLNSIKFNHDSPKACFKTNFSTL